MKLTPLQSALKNTIVQLNKLTPLLQTDERGIGPDCTDHFQAIFDADAALSESLKTNNREI
jgi:hypothetical protein